MTPNRDDERAHAALHKLLESLGNATGVLLNLREYLEALEDRYSHLGRRVVRAMLIGGTGFALALVVNACQISAVEKAQGRAERAATRAENATERLERRAVRNTVAIRVSCTLLSNAIIRSGAAAGQTRRKPTAQDKVTALLIGQIVAGMSPEQRAEIQRLQRIAARSGGGRVDVPDCDDVAAHPEAVRAIPLNEP